MEKRKSQTQITRNIRVNQLRIAQPCSCLLNSDEAIPDYLVRLTDLKDRLVECAAKQRVKICFSEN